MYFSEADWQLGKGKQACSSSLSPVQQRGPGTGAEVSRKVLGVYNMCRREVGGPGASCLALSRSHPRAVVGRVGGELFGQAV